MIRLIIILYIGVIQFAITSSNIINFELLGAIANDDTYDVALHNGKLFNKTINNLQDGDTFLIPNKTFSLTGGIYAGNLTNILLLINGNIKFNDDRSKWPKKSNGKVMSCIYLKHIYNFTITSDNKGTLDGNGRNWWGAINYLEYQGDRPRLLHMKYSKKVLIEKVSIYIFIHIYIYIYISNM
jgi:hypothetical protein